ncbi:uncharacterized protein TNCT_706801 [Trichonephila clavata]|uniref:Uncharacterized protein n=1 Tax=Trichonephila clavata TaxID=2740835 RepID=A0A8X6KLQ3_TRICU|nr:uncharacterized protein TNCT_706801 [Trichonephila clavata]
MIGDPRVCPGGGGRGLLVRHSQRGAGPCDRRGEGLLHAKSAGGPLSALRQQARHEAVRQQKSAHEGEDTAKSGRPLGHTPLQ